LNYINVIDAQANLNLQNIDDWTALMYITCKSYTDNNIKTFKLLMDAGANLNLQSKYGRTTLMQSNHSHFVNLSLLVHLQVV